MNSKNTFILVIFICIAQVLNAQFKVDESSGKEPDWTTVVQRNYFIGIGSGNSMSDAKDKAMLNIKSQIINAVADNITTSTEINTKEITRDEFSEMYQNYSKRIKSESGMRDYIQGISASKADDYYWEKLYNKKTKEVKYKYYIKYYFSQFDLDELVKDFNEKDQLLTKEMEDALKIMDNYTTIEEIIQCKNTLQQLSDIFIDERKAKCKTGIEKCNALLASVYITDAGSELGLVRYSLKIGDKVVKTAQTPVVRSNCVRITNKKFGDFICEVNYQYDECYDEPGNHIKVYYSIGNNKPEKTFYFDITGSKVEIAVNGNIHIQGGTVESGMVSDAICVIPVYSKYDSEFEVTNVTLEWKEHNIIADIPLNKDFKGEGQHDLRFNISDKLPVKKISTSSNTQNTVNGYLTYKSLKTGEVSKIRIYKQDYVTAW